MRLVKDGKLKGKNKDFELFKSYFLKYQKEFGLTGYKVYFKYEPIDDGFADITANQERMVATVKLNRELEDKNKPFKDVKRSAKHEAIHLLLHRLVDRACCRYVQEDEIYETTEELVFKLENLIKD